MAAVAAGLPGGHGEHLQRGDVDRGHIGEVDDDVLVVALECS